MTVKLNEYLIEMNDFFFNLIRNVYLTLRAIGATERRKGRVIRPMQNKLMVDELQLMPKWTTISAHF